MEQVAEVRLRHRRGESNRSIAKACKLSRNTVRKILQTGETEHIYKKGTWETTLVTNYEQKLNTLLEERNAEESYKKKKTIKLIYQTIREEGFTGSYDTVRRYVKKWETENLNGINKAFVPQVFSPGEAFQFDWSEETVSINGESTKIYLAHIVLCYSRMTFLKAYPRMTLETVLDAHISAHNFFEGLPIRGIYDNLKTVVDKIGKGKERIYNKQFIRLASHYVFEITACTPASGWEKGTVERNVQTCREIYFKQNKNYKDIDELNSLIDSFLIQYAKSHNHPEYKDKMIYEVFENEKKYLVKQESDFDGYVTTERHVRKDCLISYDNNYYSAPCQYANRIVTVRVYVYQIKLEVEGKVIAEHKRSYDNNVYVCNPEHYLPLLKLKPGSLRNGRPFLSWALPENIKKMWTILMDEPGGDRKLANILCEIPVYGIDIVEEACRLSLEKSIHSDASVVNLIRRLSDKTETIEVIPPKGLELKNPPIPNIKKYDNLIVKKDVK